MLDRDTLAHIGSELRYLYRLEQPTPGYLCELIHRAELALSTQESKHNDLSN